MGVRPCGSCHNDFNAFTVTTGEFTVPNVSSNVTINVSALGQSTGIWAIAGQEIYIATAGYYRVVSSTATTIVATNVGTTGNAAPTTVIAIGSAVGPAGRVGATGTGTAGAAGQDGTTQLVSLWGATAASGTSFSALHSVVNLPSSGAALLWPTIGSVLRIHLASVMSTVSGNDLTNHWRGEVQIVLDGVSLTVPVSSPYLSSRTYSPMNGMAATIDVSAISLSPLELVVDVRSYQTGLGSYDGTNGYAIANASSSVRAIFGNAFASGYTSGVDQSSNVTLQVNGRRIAVGTPGGSPSLFMPMLKVERLIKP